MNDPVLIFFVALAAFLSYRLFSVLGTRGGHEPKDADRVKLPTRDVRQEPDPQEAAPKEVPTEKLPDWAQKIRPHYATFDPDHFVDGAKQAYEQVVEAFARGNLDPIREFVDPQVMKALEVGVDGRRNAGQTLEVNFVGIERAEVESAEIHSEHIDVVVAFWSDQVRVTRNAEGEVVDGDPNRIDQVRDRWTFSRPLSATGPAWTLTATGGA